MSHSADTNKITETYGFKWPSNASQLDVELSILRKNLRPEHRYEHYEALQKLLWPSDDFHRWAQLALRTLVAETITVLMGPADCGKTYPAAKWALMEYWIDPDYTLVLVSSTDVRGLELRVWGAIKDLFNRAIERFPDLPGMPLDSLHAITTDERARGEKKARVLRKGIVCIPCMQSGKYVGLGKYIGVKQKRLRQIADECQLMGASFLDAVPNFLGKDYMGAFLGNPLDPLDPLGRVAEPVEGWEGHEEPDKTTTWRTRFHNGVCVNFVGTDSPNFDFPKEEPIRYSYMISWKKLEKVADFWGEDSIQYYSQCKGVMRFGLVGKRVITRELCKQHGASEPAVWQSEAITRVYYLDPAYGGEDRCAAGYLEFGFDPDGKQIMRAPEPWVIPVHPGTAVKPEDQIAMAVARDLTDLDIPPSHAFYDSFGKGTIGFAFARIFGESTPVPVDTGAKPSSRPVRYDLFIFDERLGYRRLKRCDEHYSKFVTELWFSVRYVIECGQMRELTGEVITEGCLREYGMVAGNKIELEDKKETRKRMGRSPDFFDGLAVGVEGCRQLGFRIGADEELTEMESRENEMLRQAERDYRRIIQNHVLTHY